jgi:3-isopropylmalate dehydrogenase
VEALIGILPGDGIGPEVTAEAVSLLRAVAEIGGHNFELTDALIGGAAIDATGDAFPAETRELAAAADAVLLGAVGGPKWSNPDAPVRPEQGLLDLRAAMSVYANLRPVKTHPSLYSASPLRPELLEDVDILVVRELTGGIYFGEKRRSADEATDVCTYTRGEIERVIRLAAGFARDRSGRVTSVDKANVLETSRLWRAVAEELAEKEFAGLQFEHLLVDAAAMHLLSRPADFDVIVTENMFGDILTDEASMLVGSLGLLPSASLGDSTRGIYEPIHGSAPDIAGKGIANPVAMIASAAMLLRYSLQLDEEANALEDAISAVIAAGGRTADTAANGEKVLSTRDFTDAIVRALN